MKLNMREGLVQNAFHPCGTAHCHAGVYLIGAAEIKKGKVYGSSRGAELMAHNLGFENSDALQRWVYQNPDIWGSENGGWLFCDKKAFDNAESITEIAAWWRNVGGRVKEDNLKNSKS